jgi:hypothetical protein
MEGAKHKWGGRYWLQALLILTVTKYIYLPPIYLYFIQNIEDRFLLLTSSTSFWSAILGTSDDEKVSYGSKSMHIFNMSKIRYSHTEYDTRKWCATKPEPNRAKVGSAGPTSLADRPGVGTFSNSALPTYQGRLVHGASNVQSRCKQKTWPPDHPSWSAGLTSGPPEPHFRPKHWLSPPINTTVLLSVKGVKKVRFSFL